LRAEESFERRRVGGGDGGEAEGGEQPGRPPVSVQERVNCLKLNMGECDLDEWRNAVGRVKKCFKIAQCAWNEIGRGRDKSSIRERTSALSRATGRPARLGFSCVYWGSGGRLRSDV
jgi:hypothetical protein